MVLLLYTKLKAFAVSISSNAKYTTRRVRRKKNSIDVQLRKVFFYFLGMNGFIPFFSSTDLIFAFTSTIGS